MNRTKIGAGMTLLGVAGGAVAVAAPVGATPSAADHITQACQPSTLYDYHPGTGIGDKGWSAIKSTECQHQTDNICKNSSGTRVSDPGETASKGNLFFVNWCPDAFPLLVDFTPHAW